MLRIAASLLLTLAPLASAASAPPAEAGACPPALVLPPDFAAWSEGTRATASVAAADAPVLGEGRAHLALREGAKLAFAMPPEMAPAARTWGGLVAIDIARPGRLTVALGKAAWIDVVRDGVRVASTGHAHGPACSGIRKLVDFAVEPGRYTLQISGADDADIDVMTLLRD